MATKNPLAAASSAIIVLIAGLLAQICHAEPNSLEERRAEILTKFDSASRGRTPLLSGQFVSGPNWPEAYNLYFEGFYNETGTWPEILGVDYSVNPPTTSPRAIPARAPQNLEQQLTERILAHWKRGGITMVSWQIDNPWYRLGTGPSCSNAPSPCVPGTVDDLLDLKTPTGRYFRAQMSDIGDILEQLQKRGVVVLFRPFHELNGYWFWWGTALHRSYDDDAHVVVWNYVYKYLTEDRRLKNIIWVYAPNNGLKGRYTQSNGKIIEPAVAYIPRTSQFDIVGLDFYSDTICDIQTSAPTYLQHCSIPDYENLLDLKKPFGLAEFGPSSPQKGNFPFDDRVSQLRKNYPDIGFFMAWQDAPRVHNIFSLVTNGSALTLSRDSNVETLNSKLGDRNPR